MIHGSLCYTAGTYSRPIHGDSMVMEQAFAYRNRARSVVIGIGANLGDPQEMVSRVLDELMTKPWLEGARASSLYKSSPVGFVEQPDFVNAVVVGMSVLAPHIILEELQEMESRAGRGEKRVFWGPRVLDLDLLVVGDESISEDRLQLPHSQITKRRFVLEPLHELEPHWKHPLTGESIKSLMAELPEGDVVERIERAES